MVITGASSGIGRQTAIDFARQGAAQVIMAARSGDKLSELAGEIASASPGCNAIPYVCDVSDAQVLNMAEDVLERSGRVDILVNNAGFAVFKTVRT